MTNYHLGNRGWQFINKHLRKEKHIRKTEKIRPFIEGVYFILKGGCQWRLLPEEYGKWSTVYKSFIRWGGTKESEKIV